MERPLQRPACRRRGREPGRGGSPPPPSPTCRTDPLAADRAAHEYTPGGRTGDNRWQADARRGGGAGGGGAAPRPSPPPAPPPSLRATGATLRPPGTEETPPLPQKGLRRGGGMRLDLHTARPSAPSRLLPQGSWPTGEPTPARRSGARTKPGGGTRRRTRTVWGPRPS